MKHPEPIGRRRKLVSAAVLFAALPLLGPSAALAQEEADTGRFLAAACASCHGAEGRAAGTIPPLAGQDATELEAKLSLYAAGEPATAIMSRIAPSYTAEERTALAAYFAGLEP